MSLSLLSPLHPPPTIFHNHHTPNPNYLTSHSKTHQKFQCFSSKPPKKNIKKPSDAQLASDFASQVQKINTQLEEKQNALIKSKEMLFSDFCNFLSMNPNEVKIKWIKMNPDEKLGLVKGFVSHWGLNFHPLSPKSVRDLVEEFVMKDIVDKNDNLDSNSTGFDSVVNLSGLKKLIMGD